eukprot:6193812-Pleurochrysis_carterae.AAC.3
MTLVVLSIASALRRSESQSHIYIERKGERGGKYCGPPQNYSFCSISKGPFGGVGSVGRGRKNAATLTGSRGMLNRAG